MLRVLKCVGFRPHFWRRPLAAGWRTTETSILVLGTLLGTLGILYVGILTRFYVNGLFLIWPFESGSRSWLSNAMTSNVGS